MEVSALKTPAVLRGPTPFLRLQSDERLVELTRRGNQSAYESLVARYQSRLQSFCRHMLGSKEDAEDVLQEVFAAAFNAMLADDRPINLRPWLYRIARNRSLNHLRRQRAVGVDSMDIHIAEGGITTADKVQKREDLRLLVRDVQGLAETQRTALLLREIDALSYDQIAEAMETTVPAIKSLLVRARVALAESAEARALTCDEVRTELGEVAEGLRRMSPPVRRHVKTCDRCAAFHDHLKSTNKALAAIFPVAPLMLLKKLLLAHVGAGNAAAGAGAGGSAAVVAGGGSMAAGSSMAAGGMLSAGLGAVATKVTAGLAAVAIVGAGAVAVQHDVRHHHAHHQVVLAAAPAPVAVPHPVAPVAIPHIVASVRQPAVKAHGSFLRHSRHRAAHKPATEASIVPTTPAAATTPVAATTPTTASVPTTPVTTTPAVPVAPITTAPPAETGAPTTPQTESDATQLPDATTPSAPQTESDATQLPGAANPTPTAPVETTPVATAPVETTPVATAPVVTTPVPATPAEPTTPATPTEPTTPTVPTTPSVPTTPTTPTTPTVPTTPAVPTTPTP